MDAVDTEPQFETRAEHVAESPTVAGVSSATEVRVLMDYGSGVTATSEELVEALQGQPENDPNRINADVCWVCACGDVVGPGV